MELNADREVLEGRREALGLQNLAVTVQDSVATLEGSARDYASRVRAEEVAGTVAGLSRISNHLMPADAPSGSDDRALTSALIAYLGDFRNFGFPAQIKVKVEGGVATLGGRVGLYFARQQAAVLASLVKGISRVDNRIKVDTTLMPRIGGQRPQSMIEAGP